MNAPESPELWKTPEQILSVVEANAAGQVLTEVIRYRKHFPFVHYRNRLWAGIDSIGIWLPNTAGDIATIHAHIDRHDWLVPLVDAINLAHSYRCTPPYDPNYASTLSLGPGERFPAHQDFGRRHSRSILALTGVADVMLYNMATARVEQFRHMPGQQYEMQIAEDELGSVLHSVHISQDGSRTTIVA